jgi:FkbM family methyltransferase
MLSGEENGMYRHLPKLLENSRLFRFLFLVRKLIFIKSCRRCYSQYGEDVAMRCFLDPDQKGFYVDVGCFHPKKYSNTYRLYKKGWRGINIDVDEIKISAFNLLRRRDINVCSAVSDNDDEFVELYSFGFWTLINTLDRKTAETQGPGYVVKKVRNQTLNKILASHDVEKVDLLSVDVEGYDLHVLKSVDLKKYGVRTIIVELHVRRLEEVMQEELYQYLVSQGYSLVNWIGPSLVFQAAPVDERAGGEAS